MAMTGSGMGAAIFDQVKSIPGINITDSAELQAFCNAVGTGVVQYIQASADVLPGTLNNPAGQAVSTPAGPGETSSPQVIAGLGKVQ